MLCNNRLVTVRRTCIKTAFYRSFRSLKDERNTLPKFYISRVSRKKNRSNIPSTFQRSMGEKTKISQRPLSKCREEPFSNSIGKVCLIRNVNNSFVENFKAPVRTAPSVSFNCRKKLSKFNYRI